MPMKSLVDTAYDVLSDHYAKCKGDTNKEPLAFLEILNNVGIRLDITEDDLVNIASRFYTDLTLDGRFVVNQNNKWVLREHQKYDDIKIDMSEAYKDDEEDKKIEDNGLSNEDEVNSDDELQVDDSEKESELGEEPVEDHDVYRTDDDDENN